MFPKEVKPNNLSTWNAAPVEGACYPAPPVIQVACAPMAVGIDIEDNAVVKCVVAVSYNLVAPKTASTNTHKRSRCHYVAPHQSSMGPGSGSALVLRKTNSRLAGSTRFV